MRLRLMLSIVWLLALGSCGSHKESTSDAEATAGQCKLWYTSAYDLYARADSYAAEAEAFYAKAAAKQKECNPFINFFLLSSCQNAATKLREQGNVHLQLSNSYNNQGTALLDKYNAQCH